MPKTGCQEICANFQFGKLCGTCRKLDLIIDTVSANHDFPLYEHAKIGGIHVLVGVPSEPNQVDAMALIYGRKHLADL